MLKVAIKRLESKGDIFTLTIDMTSFPVELEFKGILSC